jgi:hypothetical protein
LPLECSSQHWRVAISFVRWSIRAGIISVYVGELQIKFTGETKSMYIRIPIIFFPIHE